MAILAIDALQPTGLTSVNPSVIYILTNDTYSTVTTTGYLTTQSSHLGQTFSNTQMALVYTTDDGPVWLQVVVTFNNSSVLSRVVSLVATSGPGDVTLPTIANHIATYTNTAGGLSEDPATAISGGNIQAGLSGTAGYLASFPGTASKGSFLFKAVANTGNTITTLSNDAMGQASVINIPDPGNAIGQLLIGATATPFTSGNLPKASGTAGLMVDSGVAATSVQLSTNIKAAQVASLGGGGAGPLTVTAAGCLSTSVVVVSIVASSNAASVIKVVPGSGSFALTLSADPGATLTISYVMFIAPQ